MLKIYPGKISGEITPPSSKSVGHRTLICAALAKGESRISNLNKSKDIEATLACLKIFGADIRKEGTDILIKGKQKKVEEEIYCNESGSTLRFLIPLFTLDSDLKTFTGSGKLMQRPQDVYKKLYEEIGGLFYYEDNKLKVKGPLKPGIYELDGMISSQFFTGLLLALPLLEADSKLIVKNKLESKSYLDITMKVMEDFGVKVSYEDVIFYIPGNQKYQSCNYYVESDYSSAAFLKLLAQINNDIKINNLNPSSLQGDRVFFDFCEKIKESTKEICFDLADCPDLGPALMVLACLSNKNVTVNNIARLRYKESDRVECMIEELNKFGYHIEASENTMFIKAQKINEKEGIVVNSHNDHRIAMAMSCLATVYKYPVYIDGYEAVGKSYPDFYDDLKNLGIRIEYDK